MAYIGKEPASAVLSASDITDDIITTAKLAFAESTLTDGSSIDWNAATQDVCKVTLAGNRTLNAPTNPTTGQFISLLVIQDSTGSRTLSYNSVYQFVSGAAPTLSTGASDVDILVYSTRSSTTIDAALLKNFD